MPGRGRDGATIGDEIGDALGAGDPATCVAVGFGVAAVSEGTAGGGGSTAAAVLAGAAGTGEALNRALRVAATTATTTTTSPAAAATSHVELRRTRIGCDSTCAGTGGACSPLASASAA